MRLGRFFTDAHGEFWGVVEGEEVVVCEDSWFPQGDVKLGDVRIPLAGVRILPPVLPSKIVALALNYRSHAKEMGKRLPDEPLFFLKPSTAVIGHGDEIVMPAMSQRVDYEGELAVVIGSRAKDVPVEEAFEYVLGYTCMDDVTARDLQKKDGLFCRAKGFDTFAPIGPWIETEVDPGALNVTTKVNGEVKQQGNTSDLIFDVAKLISFISHVMTLEPGDIISTGTPSGIGPLAHGDLVEVSVEGIGTLRNRAVGSRRV